MLRLIWNASIRIRTFMRVWMPTNILLDALRTRRGLRWGVPAMLLAVGYFAIAYWCTTLIDAGAPGWLHLIVLLCIINAFKFLIHGPISLVRLIRARRSERRQARAEARARLAMARRTARVPAEYEALPQHEHGPTHLSRAPAAPSAWPQASGHARSAPRRRTPRPRTRPATATHRHATKRPRLDTRRTGGG